MIELGEKRTVFVDCDDTLLNWFPEKYPHQESELITFQSEHGDWKLLPHFKHIEFLKNLKRQGYTIVVWSAASGTWATKVVNLLGIQAFVDITMSKPEFAIDDLLDAKKIIKQIIYIDPITGDFKRNA